MGRALALVLLILSIRSVALAQTASSTVYPDSPEGFRQQLEDLIAAKKSGDDATFRPKLDALALPNVDDWIAAHFSPADVAKLQHDYALSLTTFQGHLSWVAGHAVRMRGWEMTLKASELPKPPATTGPEAAIPVPSASVSVESFIYGPAHPEDSKERSWVNSFIYLDGCFRYAGGSYSFWSEGLRRMRAPQAGPPEGLITVRAAHLLHKVTPNYPKKARREHVEGVVRLHCIIDKDGYVRELTVVSGDPLLTDAALKAVRRVFDHACRYSTRHGMGSPLRGSPPCD